MEDEDLRMHQLAISQVHSQLKKALQERPKRWGSPPRRPNPPEDPPPIPIVQPVEFAGTLYLLRCEALNMPCICNKNMLWLLYFKVLEGLNPTFRVETQNVDYEHVNIVPRFETENRFYDNLEDFNRYSNLSLNRNQENRARIADEERQKAALINELIIPLEDAFTYGCSLLLTPAPWIAERVDDIKIRLQMDNHEQLQQHLRQKMDTACRTLSDMLGNQAFFLEDFLVDKLHNTHGCTMVDVKHAATSMLIMKCFESGPEVLSYTSNIKMLLHRHIALWSHADRFYSLYIKERIVRDYGARDLDAHVTVAMERGHQGSGNFGNVYKVHLPADSDWGLPEGYYAFKIAKNRYCRSHFETEAFTLRHLPYENVATLVGHGKINELNFLITKWEHGGNLQTRIDKGDLTWEQVKKILKGIAYSLHMIHRTGKTCVVDFKPENILLNESHDPILCDMGLANTSGNKIQSEAGTQTYHDNAYSCGSST